jgi:glycosyltransferase involved in cell wall biosynthesis
MDNNYPKMSIPGIQKNGNILQPLVSVITVCLNSSKDIEKTITSVINQTYPNLEYVIVDGGSDDGTLEIIKKYGSSISQWISEPDEGIYDAMNKGINLSSGDWLIFINSGDSFSDADVLEKIINILNEEKNTSGNTGLIYGNALVVNEELGIEYKLGKKIKGIRDFYFSFDKQPVCHQAVLFYRSLFKEIGPYDRSYILLGDYEWFIRFFSGKRGYIAKYINADIVKFQMDGLSFKMLEQALFEKKKIAVKYFPPFELTLYYLSLPFIQIKFKILNLIKGKKIFRIYRISKYRIFKSPV